MCSVWRVWFGFPTRLLLSWPRTTGNSSAAVYFDSLILENCRNCSGFSSEVTSVILLIVNRSSSISGCIGLCRHSFGAEPPSVRVGEVLGGLRGGHLGEGGGRVGADVGSDVVGASVGSELLPWVGGFRQYSDFDGEYTVGCLL